MVPGKGKARLITQAGPEEGTTQPRVWAAAGEESLRNWEQRSYSSCAAIACTARARACRARRKPRFGSSEWWKICPGAGGDHGMTEQEWLDNLEAQLPEGNLE